MASRAQRARAQREAQSTDGDKYRIKFTFPGGAVTYWLHPGGGSVGNPESAHPYSKEAAQKIIDAQVSGFLTMERIS